MKSNPINQLILTTIIIGVSLVISNIMVATVQQDASQPCLCKRLGFLYFFRSNNDRKSRSQHYAGEL